MSPLTLIDALLTEWASPKVRRSIHALLSLALIVATVWVAAEGNWEVALGTLIATLYTEANRVNTPEPDEDDDPSVDDEEDVEFEGTEFDGLHGGPGVSGNRD